MSERIKGVNKKNLLFPVSLAAFPLGFFLMYTNPMYYFFGIIACFVVALLQAPRSSTSDKKQAQDKLRWTMLIVGLYLLSGFAVLFFF